PHHPHDTPLYPYTTLFRSHERHDQDPERGRDHQQDPAEEIGGHGLRGTRESQESWMSPPPLEFRRLVRIVPPSLGDSARKSGLLDRKSTRLNSRHLGISYA